MTARVHTFAPNGRSGCVTGAHLRFSPREKNVTVNAQFPPDIVSSIRVPRTAKKAYDLSAITHGSCFWGGQSNAGSKIASNLESTGSF
jgi:hypothetical protein